MTARVLRPRRVLTPAGWLDDHDIVVDEGLIRQVAPRHAAQNRDNSELDGDLVPGFIDLQVNGGGGVLFNDEPTVDGIAAIGAAHGAFGTTGFLPTLISDDLDKVAAAIAAVDAAIRTGVPGVLGIHLEGPFLNPDRGGIHDASKFLVPDEAALELLCSLRNGRTLVTLAPEVAPPGFVRALAAGGVVVAAGHTMASAEDLRAAFDEGLTGVTHLFNAMSQLGSRAPGVVGGALASDDCWAGLIVDGHHVHPTSLRAAYKAMGADRLALVTDAMPTVGGPKSFMLGKRRISAEDGRCFAEDGTLAGSDLDMATCVRNAVRLMSVDLATAVRMASATPARVIGVAGVTGEVRPGLRADLALLGPEQQVLATFTAGKAT